MKTLKILATIALCISTLSGFSQIKNLEDPKKFEIEVSDPATCKLKLFNLAGNLKIVAGNSNKIIIEVNGIEPMPKRAEGLKRVGARGEDNTGAGLNYKKNVNNYEFYGAVSLNSKLDYTITVPKNLSIVINLGIFNHGDIEISDITSYLEIDVKNSDIKLNNITGPTVISSLSANIDIKFSKVNQSSPFSIKAISGDIDISLPENTPADLSLSSMSGGIYTDFDIQPTENDMHHIGGGKVNSKINNGGVHFQISAISGNIYLRKKK